MTITLLTPGPRIVEAIPEARIVEDMPAEQYHAHPSMSFSLLKNSTGGKTPVDFYDESWLNPNRPGEVDFKSEAYHFGRALHALILEPWKFEEEWRADPKFKTSSKPFTLGGAEGGQWDRAMQMRDAIAAVPEAVQILTKAKSEVSMFAPIEVSDPQSPHRLLIEGRCRHDIWKPDYTGDFKFVEDASKGAIAKAITEYKYDQQAEWYLRMMNLCGVGQHNNFVFIFVEKTRPFKVAVAYMTGPVLQRARELNDAAIDRFKENMLAYGDKVKWPGHEGIMNVTLPGEGGSVSIELPERYNYRT